MGGANHEASKEAAKARLELEIQLQRRHQESIRLIALKQLATRLSSEAKAACSVALFIWKANQQNEIARLRAHVSGCQNMSSALKRLKEKIVLETVAIWRSNFNLYKRTANAVFVVCAPYHPNNSKRTVLRA